jgi:hypothetical protein
MNAARRFRWLPRFSLSNLLMLMVVAGLCLAWYDQRRKLGEQAEAIEKQRLEIVRLTVTNILHSYASDTAKVESLQPFVTLGLPREEVERFLGTGTPTPSGGMTWYECELLVTYDANGLVKGLGYLRLPDFGEMRYVTLAANAGIPDSEAVAP